MQPGPVSKAKKLAQNSGTLRRYRNTEAGEALGKFCRIAVG